MSFRSSLSAWIPVVLWASLILAFGGGVFSWSTSERLLLHWLHWLLPGAGSETGGAVHYLVRKSLHVGEYALLALLVLRASRVAHALTWRRANASSLAIVCSVAALDEVRQAFTEGRTGSVGDAALDLAGGALALALVALLPSQRRPWRAPSAAGALQ